MYIGKNVKVFEIEGMEVVFQKMPNTEENLPVISVIIHAPICKAIFDFTLEEPDDLKTQWDAIDETRAIHAVEAYEGILKERKAESV